MADNLRLGLMDRELRKDQLLREGVLREDLKRILGWTRMEKTGGYGGYGVSNLTAEREALLTEIIERVRQG